MNIEDIDKQINKKKKEYDKQYKKLHSNQNHYAINYQTHNNSSSNNPINNNYINQQNQNNYTKNNYTNNNIIENNKIKTTKNTEVTGEVNGILPKGTRMPGNIYNNFPKQHITNLFKKINSHLTLII